MSVRADRPTTGRGRLTLLPGLCRLWRDETALQLGADPSRAVIIDLPDQRTARVLDLLDGSRTEHAVLRDAREMDIPTEVTRALLAALQAANLVVGADTLLPASLPEGVRRRLLSEAAARAMAARTLDLPPSGWVFRDEPDDGGGAARTGHGTLAESDAPEQDRSGHGSAPVAASGPARRSTQGGAAKRPPIAPAEAMRRRAAASIQVVGASRLVVPIASTLARAGVGHVDPALTGRVEVHDEAIGGLTPADADRPRATAASEAVLRVAPYTDTRALRAGTATFVVQVGQGVPAELAAHAYARRALPHLLIEERDDIVLIGPLVPPHGSPCLRCLDLHRRDRDPAWPTLIAQLATIGDGSGTVATTTTIIAVGVAAAQVLGYIDGDEVPTIGASIEVGPPSTLRRRSWSAHPRCDCAHRVRGAAPGRPSRRPGPRRM